MKDTEIIKGIIEGNPENERLLFEKYDQKIYYIVYSKLGVYKNFAVDLIQDIKISLLLSIRNGNFRCENELSLGAYLYGISMNKIRDCINKSNRELAYIENQNNHLEKSYNDHFELENNELKNMIRKTLQCLKIKYQEVLYLKYFEELSVKEISSKIKLPARRVSERLNYALKLIKKEIDKTGYFA